MTLEKVEFDRHPISDPPIDGDLFEVQEAVARWADNYGQHPRIGLVKSGTQSVPDITDTVITWDEQPEYSAGFSVHNNSEVEIPLDGLYSVTAMVTTEVFTSSNKHVHAQVHRNGELLKAIGEGASHASLHDIRVHGTIDALLKKGDRLSVTVEHDHGSARDFGGDAAKSYFQIRGVW